jgi:hypothetical protein
VLINCWPNRLSTSGVASLRWVIDFTLVQLLRPAASSFVPLALVDAPWRDGLAIDIRRVGGLRLRLRIGCHRQLLAAALAAK